MNIVASLEKRNKTPWTIIGIVLIVGIGVVDLLTGYEIGFSLFYLLPISLVTWFTRRRRLGVLASITSALVWFIADIKSGMSYSHPAIYFWNTLIRFGFFIIVTLLLSALRKAHEREKELARIDSLTGAINARFFSELVQMEINRSQRYKHPFTIAYVDLDSFKRVNDQFGHSMGDKVLQTIVKYVKGQLRKIDVVGRLGGDEFAFLLPETDQAAAQVAISKIQIGILDEMHRNNWPVTFSIGVLTYIDLPQTSDELIKKADDLMYSVKNNGKNSISYSVYAG
jgi:diguanylate cyclase (GGDEF)-like protein